MVRTLACHARGQGFESPSGRQNNLRNSEERFEESSLSKERRYASVAQLVEQGTENPRVVGSIPTGGTRKCGFSSFGRASPCQGEGGGFEPRNPLHKKQSTTVVVLLFFTARLTGREPAQSGALQRASLCLCVSKVMLKNIKQTWFCCSKEQQRLEPRRCSH